MRRTGTQGLNELEIEFMRHGWPRTMGMTSMAKKTSHDRRFARSVRGGIGNGLVGLGKWIENHA